MKDQRQIHPTLHSGIQESLRLVGVIINQCAAMVAGCELALFPARNIHEIYNIKHTLKNTSAFYLAIGRIVDADGVCREKRILLLPLRLALHGSPFRTIIIS